MKEFSYFIPTVGTQCQKAGDEQAISLMKQDESCRLYTEDTSNDKYISAFLQEKQQDEENIAEYREWWVRTTIDKVMQQITHIEITY